MKRLIIDAFQLTCAGFSVDRVVADPDLNAAFLSQCGRFGITQESVKINRFLLNLRKQGDLTGIRSKRTTFPDSSAYAFAAEMAIRFLERRDRVTLDDVICDPERVAEFDSLAASIAPGYTRLQYRWAALALRKTSQLAPEILAKVIPPTDVRVFRVDLLGLDDIPTGQGLYIFFSADEPLYVGESENLRSRIAKHIDHSDNKLFARWLWERTPAQLHLEIQSLPIDTTTRIRKALELELIRSRQPLFNIQR